MCLWRYHNSESMKQKDINISPKDRIIKDFDKLEVCYAGDKYISSWCEPLDLTEDEEKVIKQFLIKSIKEVQEETRNEIIDKIFEHDIGEDGICKNCGKFITYQGYCIQHKYQKLKDKLSITNKEK